MKFRTELLLHGKTATGIEVPPDVIEALGGGKKPPVSVTIAGHAYRTTIAPRGDRFLLPVSGENRSAAGISAGDEVDVEIELDTEPRTVEVPADLAEALSNEPEAESFFASLTASQQGGFTVPIEGAKQPETRERRVAKALTALREGRKRP